MYPLPKMIIFDYGQTLINEESFQPMRGSIAVLEAAGKLSEVSPEQVQSLADSMSSMILDEFHVSDRNQQPMEFTSHAFNRYLYEMMGLDISLSPEEIEWIFWSHAAPGTCTDGIREFLKFLRDHNIRTGVVSNMMYSGKALERRLKDLLPEHDFEMVLTSSDYMFRKPHPALFSLALKKADLPAYAIWFCGDNMYCDIKGAYMAGMNPVWYPAYIDKQDSLCNDPDRYINKESYLQINSWSELKDKIIN